MGHSNRKGARANPRVVILGLGYIGIPTAAMLALHRDDVLGVDIQSKVIEAIRHGNVPVRERDLTAILRDAIRSGHLRVSSTPEVADYFVICVPTPKKGREADLSMVKAATRSIVPYLREGSTVILESTVPPGTSLKVVLPILEQSGLRGGADFSLAYCPERVLPGNIIREIAENDRVIGGLDDASAEKARDLYAKFVTGEIHLTDLNTAEFVKLAENAFRDVNVAFANELAALAEAHGVDVWEAIDLANHHPRVRILRPGPGVGGHCIAVDPWFLLHRAVSAKMIPSARAVNDNRPSTVTRKILRLVHGISRPKVAVFGVAFKGNADDIRESPAIKVIDALRAHRILVTVYDPLVPNAVYPTQPLEETLETADCIAILTDHRDFAYLDPELVAKSVRRRVLFDARHCVDHSRWRASGFVVQVLGDAIIRNPLESKARVSPRRSAGAVDRAQALRN